MAAARGEQFYMCVSLWLSVGWSLAMTVTDVVHTLLPW